VGRNQPPVLQTLERLPNRRDVPAHQWIGRKLRPSHWLLADPQPLQYPVDHRCWCARLFTLLRRRQIPKVERQVSLLPQHKLLVLVALAAFLDRDDPRTHPKPPLVALLRLLDRPGLIHRVL
jgi:hypothetical protein